MFHNFTENFNFNGRRSTARRVSDNDFDVVRAAFVESVLLHGSQIYSGHADRIGTVAKGEAIKGRFSSSLKSGNGHDRL